MQPSSTATGHGPRRSLPRWERMLLAAELGDVDRAGGSGRRFRDWIVDVALFAYAAVSAAATAVNGSLQVNATMRVTDAVLAAPACLALWTRRRHPVGVAWLTVALSAVSSAAVQAAHVAIFSAGIHARPRRAAAAAAAAIAATALVCATHTGVHRHGFNTAFFNAWSARTIAALALGSFVRVRRELVRHLQAEQQLRIREARLAERARIAREMHDVLAHRISLLSVHAGALEFNRDASPEETARGLAVIRTSARAAQEELREIVGVLRSETREDGLEPPQPTLADLGRLVEESRRAGMDVAFAAELPAAPMPALAGRTVYRVVQEALTNARKHAPTHRVSVSIAGDPGGSVEVDVVDRPAAGEDDGRPAAEHVGTGTGLVGLTERMALAGGVLEHGPLPHGGFRLHARIPWDGAGGAS